MKAKNGTVPKVFTHNLEKVDAEIESGLSSGSIFTLSWYCRKIWGTGELIKMIGNDIWEVEGYKKATLEDLILEGKPQPYRTLPDWVNEYLDSYYWGCTRREIRLYGFMAPIDRRKYQLFSIFAWLEGTSCRRRAAVGSGYFEIGAGADSRHNRDKSDSTYQTWLSSLTIWLWAYTCAWSRAIARLFSPRQGTPQL